MEPNAIKQPRITFNASLDLLLVEETSHKNPYLDKDSSAAWDKIAEILNNTKMFKAVLSGRACRERVEKLVDAFQKADLQNVSRSGIEEQYTLISAALTNLGSAKSEKFATKAINKTKIAAAAKKRDEISAEIQAAGEKTFKKSKKDDDLADYRIASTSSMDCSGSEVGTDTEADELRAMEEDPNYNQEEYQRKRRLKKLAKKKPVGGQSFGKKSTEADVVRAIVEGERKKYHYKTEELKQNRELKEQELKQQKELREKEIEAQMQSQKEAQKTNYEIRMRELDLEERKMKIRERELALQERQLFK